MTCQFSEEMLDRAVAFHGHSCPGLAIGIRAAEYALQEFGESAAGGLVCVTETDMCGVDAIQFFTGCTFGKGNLLHRDYGKAAFSFFERQSGRGIRFLLRPDAKKAEDGTQPGREEMQRILLHKPLEEVFELQALTVAPPTPARILTSLVCEHCGEETMESRTRRIGGETLCIPCFMQVEQKV
jgi:formylmethanofuran dehydrogenase subunit E